MSTTIDQRVVEMQFDNKNFEQNVGTSLSTLDKLKNALNLGGASKGLDQVSESAKKCNLNPLAQGVQEVHAKFSALEIIGITALQNIANKAVNAGETLIKSLTIDPVTSGFQEYETQINAVQTILANTKSKGSTLEDVNNALSELNTYADKTIYNFTEMTRNIGTFTAAGVDLDTSVTAIQGIANVAAVSGSTSQQASTAMYQLSQALATGTVKLMDWNSVVNAGMGGQVFQDALKKTSEELGTGAEEYIKAEGSFRESLSHGWLTSEVLTKTLAKFTESGANEYVAEYTGLSQQAVEAALEEAKAQYGEADAVEKASEALAEKSNKNKDEIQEVLDMAQTATDAATKVKTFTQLIDTLKEAAQSGWTQTWQYVVGDFEEAKEFMTQISDLVGGYIGEAANARNTVFERIFQGQTVVNLDYWNSLKNAGYATEEFKNLLSDTAKQEGIDIDKMIEDNGSWQNSLEEGWLTADIFNDTLARIGDSMSDSSEGSEQYSDSLQQIYKDSQDANTSLGDFVNTMNQPSGHDLLVTTIMQSLTGLINILKAVKLGFYDAFTDSMVEGGYGILQATAKIATAFAKLTGDGTGLRKMMAGLFSVLSLIPNAIGEVISTITGFISPAFKDLDLSADGVLGTIGGLLTQFTNFVKSCHIVSTALKGVLSVFYLIGTGIEYLIDSFKSIPVVGTFLSNLTNFAKDVSTNYDKYLGKAKTVILNFGDSLKTSASILYDNRGILSDTVKKGFKTFVDAFKSLDKITVKGVIEKLGELKDKFIDWFNSVTSKKAQLEGISTGAASKIKTFSGLLLTLKENMQSGFLDTFNKFTDAVGKKLSFCAPILDKVKDALSRLGEFVSGTFKSTDWGALLVFVGVIIAIVAVKKVFSTFTGIVEMIVNPLKSLTTGINAAAKDLKADATLKLAKALKTLVGCVAILAGIGAVNPAALGEALGGLTLIFIMLIILLKTIGNMNNTDATAEAKISVELKGLASLVLSLGVTLNLISKVVSGGHAVESVSILIGIIIVMGALLIELGKMEAGSFGEHDSKALLAFAVVLWQIGNTLTKLGKVNYKNINQNLGTIIILFGMIAILMVISSKMSKDIAGFGSTMLALSVSMVILIYAVKEISKMSEKEITTGIAVFAGLLIMFAAIVAISNISKGKSIGKNVASTILAIAASLTLLSISLKIIGSMKLGDLIKSVVILGGLMAALVGALSIIQNNKYSKSAAQTILAVSAAVAILCVAIAILALIKPENLLKSVIAVGTVLLALGASLKIVGSMDLDFKPMILLTVMIAIVSGVLIALTVLGPEKALQSAIALGTVLLALGASIKLISGFNIDIKNAAIALGIMIIVMASVAALFLVMNKIAPDANKALVTAAALTLVMGALSGMLIAVSIAGKAGGAGIAGIKTMVVAVVALVALVTALGGINKLTDGGFGDLVTEGLNILVKIAEKLGEAIGAFIGGIGVGLTSQLVTIGTNLSLFMLAVTPFVLGAKNIKAEAFSGIGALCAAIIEITGSSIVTAIGQFVTLGNGFSSLEKFADSMVSVAPKLSDASSKLDGVKMGPLVNGANAIKALAEAAAQIPNTGGLLGDLLGNNDMNEFVQMLVDSSDGLKSVSETYADVQVGPIKNASKAIAAIASAANEIPNTGGKLEKYLGSNDIDDFIDMLERSSGKLVSVSTDYADVSVDNVKHAAKAITTLAAAASDIPNDGGALGAIVGNNSIDDFIDMLDKSAGKLIGISDRFKALNMGGITKAGEAISTLASIKMPKTGGIMTAVTGGTSNLSTFGDQLNKLGKKVQDFSESVKSEASTKLKTFSSAVSSVAKTLTNMTEVDTAKIDKFNSAISALGNADLSGASSSISDAASSVKSATSAYKSAMSSASKSMATSTSSAMKSSTASAAKSVTSSSGSYTSAGKTLANALAVGFSSTGSKLATNAKKAASNAVKAVNGYYNNFKSVGSYLDSGLATGISKGSNKVTSAAKSVAKKAYDASRKELDINSPSKKFIKIGKSVDEGFAKGIDKGTNWIVGSTKDMAQKSLKTMSSSITDISSLITDGMDNSPTIRPVMDLSNVQNGVSAINGMFGDQTMGLAGNISSINSMMAARNSVSTNDDVIAAIDKLNSTIKDNSSANVTNINGITYDDGSNVVGAVQTLVNAITVEGRI